uniref:PAS domain-containing protein n=1 Tax=Halobiforma nitratireducens TaxID=130048 RepID=UPI001EF9F4DA|nr:PAS domain-containing protein [Halobiforma nitratireducens]
MNGTDGDGTTVVGDALRVLVVGDSAAVETAGDVLAAELVPAAVIRARTLEEARERLEPGTVHCVLCAYPDESGRELLAAIDPAPSDPSTPVVALTADPERALEAGATDAVSPDASAAVLANRVRRVAECARQVDRGSSRPRALLESVDAPVWLLEPDGAVAYASPAVEDRLGYAPTELERASLSRLVHPDDRSALEDGLGTLAGSPLGARERLAVRLGTAAGEWRGAALTLVNRLAAPPLEGIVATAELGSEPAVDVPDALEDLAEPLFVVGPDLALRWANAAAKQLFADGVDPEPGRLVTDVLADDIRDRFARGLHEAATSGAPVSFEVAVPDGEDAVTLAVSATPRQGEGGDGDGSDETPITVLAQERPADGERPGLEDRLAVLESTLDALEDGVAIVRDERIERANRSLVDRLGGADPVGDGLEDLFDDDLAATVRDRARSSLVRWTEPAQGDLLVADASDEGGAGTAESIPVDVYVAPLRDGTDRDRTLCLVRDRRRSAAGALSTVRRTIAAVRDAEAAAGVRRAVLEALRSRTAADLAIWYRLDDERFVPVAVSTDESVPSIEPPAIDPGRLADDERTGPRRPYRRRGRRARDQSGTARVRGTRPGSGSSGDRGDRGRSRGRPRVGRPWLAARGLPTRADRARGRTGAGSRDATTRTGAARGREPRRPRASAV